MAKEPQKSTKPLVEYIAKKEKLHEFIVLKAFTADKQYNASDLFLSNDAKTINFLTINNFIR